MDANQYRKVNETFRNRLVYHIGKDCGFFVELNYMINAMLYCLAHRLQFQIYSEDANFGTGTGWTEFFLPFCPEVHESFHRRYNFHRPPSWQRILRNTIKERSLRFIAWKTKTTLLTIVGKAKARRVYGEWVLLGQDVAAEPAQHYHIPELQIDGDYYQVYGILAKMVWRLRPDMLRTATEVERTMHLPSCYDGIQIRGGDKSTETLLVEGKLMVQALVPHDGVSIFVLTDDIRLLNDVKARYPQLRFFSLCRRDDMGYNHQAFCRTSPQEKKEAIGRLLISADILLRCRLFVGSITTGPSVFMMKVRANDDAVKAVDCPKSALKAVLTLTLDKRATLSQRFLSESVRQDAD